MKQNNKISIARSLQAQELYFFDSRTIAYYLGLGAIQTAKLLRRMENASLVARIERGKYILLGLNPEHVLSNPLFIGSNLTNPAYISFYSAMHYYGFTEQSPRTTFAATTRRKPEITFRAMHFRFVSLQPKAFFGYRREQFAGLPIVMADEEKTILDCLMFPEYANGISKIAKALQQAMDRLDLSKLVDYANALDSPSLGSRLGFLLERLGKPVEGLLTSHGAVALDPHRERKGTYHAKWHIYANVPEQEMTPEGVR